MSSSCSAPSSPSRGHQQGSPPWVDDHRRSTGRAKTRGSPLKAASGAVGNNSLPGSPRQLGSRRRALGQQWPAAGAADRSASPAELQKSESPVFGQSQQQRHEQAIAALPDDAFQPGVKHAGWLWKRFGHGHKTQWRRLWFYLVDDRLCYCEAESPASAQGSSKSPTRNLGDPTSTALYAASCSVGSRSSYSSTVFGSPSNSLAALAAGKVKYIPLDRIPVRPLPHKPREHEMDPMQRSHHPDVGIAIIDSRVLTAGPLTDPKRTVFSLVSGSHTHYLAAETPREAELWVSIIWETWLHCFSHTARGTGTMHSSGVVISQKLLAENTRLWENIKELDSKVSQADYEYWRKWVTEKAKNEELQYKLMHTAPYEVVVKTGTIKGAGTDARVYLELFGSNHTAATTATAGRLSSAQRGTATAAMEGGGIVLGAAPTRGGEVQLFDGNSKVKPFERGASDTFTVLCYDVGLPARLRIWHDNTGRHPDWFLVDITVRKKGAKDWETFPCNRWLSAEHGDNRISLELTSGSERPQAAYKVIVFTSDMRGAGTDANVYIQLHGHLGDGIKQQLLGGPSAFDRGQKDEFTVDDADLGELTAVTISHDNTGKSPGWHLDHVEVTPLGRIQPQNSPGNFLPVPDTANSGNNSPLHMSQSLRNTAGSPAMQQALHARLLGETGNTGSGVTGAPSVTYLFPCAAWLDERLGNGVTERKLLVSSTLSPKVWYNVYITTADVRGAGTDAEVYLAILGSEGSSGRIVLPSKPEHFERGCRDEFRLQLTNLGKLTKLLIGHDGRGEASTWKVELVEVEEASSGKITYFLADRWLGPSCPEGLSEVTLMASSSDPRKAGVDYQVCFITSNLRGAGTDSTVSFELTGDRGTTGCITVAAGRAAFERGCRDTFCYTRPWLGHLQQLVVWHDNAGAAAGRGPWHLEAVVVSNTRDLQVVTFPCDRWLASDTQLKVQLEPGHPAGLIRYRFDVVTSDLRGAGTDGALVLELLGQPNSSGQSAARAGPWCLDRPGAFARGQTDTFTVEGTQVQNPAILQVTLQAASQNPEWHCSYVACTVSVVDDDTAGVQRYYFIAERWFDASHGLQTTLSAITKPPQGQEGSHLLYMVRIYTSDVKGAGTDASVSLNVIGSKASSGWQQLRAKQDNFERRQEDAFTLQLPDLGLLTHLGVKLDGSGQRPAWHLDKVCIIPPAITTALPATAHGNTANGLQLLGPTGAGGRDSGGSPGCTGQPVWFVAQKWFDAVHGLEALLEAQAVDPADSFVPYQVEVYTSDIKNAGTDSRVFVQLFGIQGDSKPQELRTTKSLDSTFSRKSVDTFNLQLHKLGILSKLRVWLQGPGSPWHLELVVVRGPEGEVTFFPCGRWLGAAATGDSSGQPVQGTAAMPLELLPCKHDPRHSQRDYKVVTRTSDIRGAGTDASVYVALIGNNDSTSGIQQLQPTRPYTFDQGQVDEFRIRCSALGDLAHLRIGHDGNGSHPGWHLLQVEVTDLSTNRTWYFEADCWLDAAQGDGRTERLLHASSTDPLADRQTYQVTVHTSKRPDAAKTEGASVYLTLHGSHGTPVTSINSNSTNTDSSKQLSSERNSKVLCSPRFELTGGGPGSFTEGGVGSFTLPAIRNLGQLRQITLELVALVESCSWHCQHLEVSSSINERWLFPCDAWLTSGSGSSLKTPVATAGKPKLVLLPAPNLVDMWRQLELEMQQQQEQYRIAVYTSDESSPASDAALSVTMYGSMDEAGPFELSRERVKLFQPGACDVFDVTSPVRLGQLQRLQVVAQRPMATSTWQLETISITAASTGITSWFFANHVFSNAAEAAVMLEASETDITAQMAKYKVTVHTSDVPDAGTTARVYMELNGTSNSSSPKELSNPVSSSSSSHKQQPFQRRQADCFILKCFDLGEVQRLTIWHDGSGSKPSWNLAYVEVQHMPNGPVWYFPCDQWLDSNKGDRATRRTIQSAKSFDPDILLCHYHVTVTTGNVRGAGTDAHVHIVIHGADGNTGHKELAQGLSTVGACFQRHQTDQFRVSGADVGVMTHIVIGHDGSGTDSAWFLAEVEVQHLGTGQKLHFDANRWLGEQHGGSSSQCELWPGQPSPHPLPPPSPPQSQPIWELPAPPPPQPQTNWELVVITGQETCSGTDADVFIQLTGSNGSFGPHQLPAGPEAFGTGCRDTFRLVTPSIGELQQVTISHNNMGFSPAWFLQRLELTNLDTGVKYVFQVAAWLDDAIGLSSTLWASQPPPIEPGRCSIHEAGCSYELEIKTSNLEGAGTDAQVFVQLNGVLGDTEALQLQPATAAAFNNMIGARAVFQQGSQDVFVLHGLPDIGAFTHLRIGHDGSGQHSAWHLAWVRAVNLDTGVRALFVANTWLDLTIPGSNSWLRLTAGPDQPLAAPVPSSPRQSPLQPVSARLTRNWSFPSKLGQPGYQVTLHTSNIMAAGTGSKVFFELIGEHGSSGIVYFTSQHGQFDRGHQDLFLYPRLPYLGQLYQLRVGTDGTGMFAAWHLRQVEVLHVHSGQRWLFQCHDWIDKKCSWQRVLPAVPVAALPAQ